MGKNKETNENANNVKTNTNTKRRGAPTENKNALGNRGGRGALKGNQYATGNRGGGAPMRNKNALTTGEYETIFYPTNENEVLLLCLMEPRNKSRKFYIKRKS